MTQKNIFYWLNIPGSICHHYRSDKSRYSRWSGLKDVSPYLSCVCVVLASSCSVIFLSSCPFVLQASPQSPAYPQTRPPPLPATPRPAQVFHLLFRNSLLERLSDVSDSVVLHMNTGGGCGHWGCLRRARGCVHPQWACRSSGTRDQGCLEEPPVPANITTDSFHCCNLLSHF